jgi:hypothetical protein
MKNVMAGIRRFMSTISCGLGTGSLLDKQQMTEIPNRLLSAVLGALRRLNALYSKGVDP